MLRFVGGEGPDPKRLGRLLGDHGIDLIVVDPLSPPYNPWGRAHAFFAGIDPLRALLILIKYRSSDLVVSVFESGALVLVFLRRMFLFKPCLALWDVSEGADWLPRRLVLNLVLPRIDRLMALTRWQKISTECQYSLRSPADVIGYAVDEEFFHPEFAKDEQYLLSIGEDNGRDYQTLTEAVRNIPVTLILKTRQSITLPADSLASIRQIPGRLTYLELRDLYASASMVLLPLHPTGHPSGITSLFEAMAMGKPIVASDTPMTREFITSGQTGLLVPFGDASALRDAIDSLLDQPEERQRLGYNARQHLEANLSLSRLADRYAASVRSLCRGRRRGRRDRDVDVGGISSQVGS